MSNTDHYEGNSSASTAGVMTMAHVHLIPGSPNVLARAMEMMALLRDIPRPQLHDEFIMTVNKGENVATPVPPNQRDWIRRQTHRHS